MNGIASAILFGIITSVPEPEATAGAERSERTEAAIPPPRPVVYVVVTSDMIRATIRADARLHEHWRRGSALLGAGIVATGGAAAMFFGSVLASERNDWCGTWSSTQNGHTVTMEDPCPNHGIGRTSIGLLAGGLVLASAGALMIGFGIRDRVIAKRAARQRLSLAAAPTRNGASFAFTLRF